MNNLRQQIATAHSRPVQFAPQEDNASHFLLRYYLEMTPAQISSLPDPAFQSQVTALQQEHKKHNI
jgi:hypothetical protein